MHSKRVRTVNMKKPIQNKKFPNRIREWRVLREMSHEKLAEAVGTSRGQIYQLETGQRRLTEEWMNRLAKPLRCEPSDLMSTSAPRMVQLVGYVGAGAQIFPYDDNMRGGGIEEVDCPPSVEPSETVALRVVGESMMPFMPNGTIVYYTMRHEGGCDDYLNKLCVVQISEGATLLKILKKGYSKGLYNLMSYNADMIEDVKLEWCARIIFIKPV